MAPVWPGMVLAKALTLESGRQVHFAAGKEAGKKLHDHLHSVAQTGRLRLDGVGQLVG